MTTATFVANARMYAPNRALANSWESLFALVAERTKIDLEVVAHAYPAKLDDLWEREDLGLAFICGFPFMRRFGSLIPVAAPVPEAAFASGLPYYRTELVVRRADRFGSLADTFGKRIGFTVENSHSGFNALRHHLLAQPRQNMPLYAAAIGPLVTPRRVFESLNEGIIDVGPLDSYAFELLRHTEPALCDTLEVLASTEAAPIPFLAASPNCPDEAVALLRKALISLPGDSVGRSILSQLFLRGFAPVSKSNYDVISRWDNEAVAAGWTSPASFAVQVQAP